MGGHPSVGGTMDCDASDLRYDGVLIPHSPGASDILHSDFECTTTTRYWHVEGEGRKHMPKPRKGWSLEECQGMCQDDNCTAWQWWPVEGGCRWFTGKVSSAEKEGHPSVGGTMDCEASDLRYDGVLIPHFPGSDFPHVPKHSDFPHSDSKCTTTTRYWHVEGEGRKHMPKPRKGWSLEECQGM